MKPGLVTRVVTAIIFVGLLATPLIIKRVSAHREAAQAKLDAKAAKDAAAPAGPTPIAVVPVSPADEQFPPESAFDAPRAAPTRKAVGQ